MRAKIKEILIDALGKDFNEDEFGKAKEINKCGRIVTYLVPDDNVEGGEYYVNINTKTGQCEYHYNNGRTKTIWQGVNWNRVNINKEFLDTLGDRDIAEMCKDMGWHTSHEISGNPIIAIELEKLWRYYQERFGKNLYEDIDRFCFHVPGSKIKPDSCFIIEGE
jgi:hypothetical protein